MQHLGYLSRSAKKGILQKGEILKNNEKFPFKNIKAR